MLSCCSTAGVAKRLREQLQLGQRQLSEPSLRLLAQLTAEGLSKLEQAEDGTQMLS